MTLLWSRDKGILAVNGLQFNATSIVRNELNDRRKLHDPKEVVRSIVNGKYDKPYMPRPFPFGTFNVTGIEIVEDKTSDFWPIKIKTNASQLVTTWALDKDGGYDHATDQKVVDSGYHLHFGFNSSTTLGCGRVGLSSPSEILKLAGLIWDELKKGVTLVVT